MSSQLFESPSHEAHYSSPEAHYSSLEAHYNSPEAHEVESEFEMQGSPEAHEIESEFETHFTSPEAHYSSPEANYSTPESHYGSPEAHYGAPEAHEEESEFESHYGSPEAHEEESEFETHYGSPEAHEIEGETEWESELEGEFFFGRLKKLARGFGRVIAPLAKRFAPMIAKTLVGAIPGVGAILGPVAGQLVGQLTKEAEAESAAMEAQLFGPASGEGEFELENTEAAHEAALAEVLAAQAAEATTEAEAESLITAALPITIRISGGRRSLRRVMPVLAQANRILVKTLRTQAGPDGRQLLRVVPKIQRQTAIALRNASRRGHRVNGALATRVMAAVTRRVLSNSPGVARAITRNLVIRNTVAPAHRHVGSIAKCVGCVGRGRPAFVARRAAASPTLPGRFRPVRNGAPMQRSRPRI